MKRVMEEKEKNRLLKLVEESQQEKKKIMKMVECPVCMMVPRSDNIPVCKNGHITCEGCKRYILINIPILEVDLVFNNIRTLLSLVETSWNVYIKTRSNIENNQGIINIST